ncbi:MAG: hypothetical protein Q8P59_08925 [Dehalococcoidia bacterium]|nr:hypothetical protein [Dehalococcoidia bacterium]
MAGPPTCVASGAEFDEFFPDKVKEVLQCCSQVIGQVALLNLGFGPIVEMLGSGGESWEIGRVIMPVYQPTLGSMLPVKGIPAAGWVDPEVDKAAIPEMKAQFLGKASSFVVDELDGGDNIAEVRYRNP